MIARRTLLLFGAIAGLAVGLVGPAHADAKDDVKAALDGLLKAVVDRDRDAVSALLDTRGFCALGGEGNSVEVINRRTFIDWLLAQPVSDGTALGETDIEVWGSVALATGPLTTQPGGEEIQLLAVLSTDRGKWKINALAAFDSLTGAAEGAQVAREIHGTFVSAADDADPETALDYLHEASFVTVVSDPMGMTYIFTDSAILRSMLQTVALSEGDVSARFGTATVRGDSSMGMVTCGVDVAFGGMKMPMRGVFLVAHIDNEWVVPLLAVGPQPEPKANDADGNEDDAEPEAPEA